MRLPPHSEEAEAGVLGCILTDPKECLDKCIELLHGSESFYDLRHQLLYQTILELNESAQPIDTLLLHQKLLDAGKLELVGGMPYLFSIRDSGTPSAANLPYYLGILEEKYIRRQIIKVCTKSIQEAYDSALSSSELIDALERDVMSIRPHFKSASTIREIMRRSMAEIEAMHQNGGKLKGIQTGLVDLDRLTGGLRPSEVTIIAAYPGVGKTSLALNVAAHALLASDKSVAVFSLEMSAELLTLRFLCSHARVNSKNVNDGQLCESDFVKLAGAAASISKSKLWLEDPSDLTIFQLKAKARRLFQQHGLDLIIVDYLQLLTGTDSGRTFENRQQEVSDISRGIKSLSCELNVPIIALSQLNDDGKLRESRAIGQDADNIWILKDMSKDSDPDNRVTPAELHVAKARNASCGKVHLTFLRCYTRFESAAKIDRADAQQAVMPYKDE